MIAAVHAAVGAAVGKGTGSRPEAFVGGVATHLLADLLPHKDFPLKVEAPLLAAALVFLAWRCGVSSPEFVGAAGAVAPDAENAARLVGLIPIEALRFPTHIGNGRYHGRKVASALPQAILAALCFAYVLAPKGEA